MQPHLVLPSLTRVSIQFRVRPLVYVPSDTYIFSKSFAESNCSMILQLAQRMTVAA